MCLPSFGFRLGFSFKCSVCLFIYIYVYERVGKHHLLPTHQTSTMTFAPWKLVVASSCRQAHLVELSACSVSPLGVNPSTIYLYTQPSSESTHTHFKRLRILPVIPISYTWTVLLHLYTECPSTIRTFELYAFPNWVVLYVFLSKPVFVSMFVKDLFLISSLENWAAFEWHSKQEETHTARRFMRLLSGSGRPISAQILGKLISVPYRRVRAWDTFWSPTIHSLMNMS